MKSKSLSRETIRHLGTENVDISKFKIGDTIKVALRIQEGDKKRIQIFEGDVIAMRNHGISSTFTVRKISAGSVAVERIFPLYSPLIASIEFVRRGKVRRAKLYYIRERVGKQARVQERVLSQEERQKKVNIR